MTQSKYTGEFAVLLALSVASCVGHREAPLPVVTATQRQETALVRVVSTGLGDASVPRVEQRVPSPPEVRAIAWNVAAPRRWTLSNGLQVEHFVRPTAAQQEPLPLTHLSLIVRSIATTDASTGNVSHQAPLARWMAQLLRQEGTRRHPRTLFFHEMARTGTLPSIDLHPRGLVLSWTFAADQLDLALRAVSALFSEPALGFSTDSPPPQSIDVIHVLRDYSQQQVQDALAVLPRIAPALAEDFVSPLALGAFGGPGAMRAYARACMAASAMTLVLVAPDDPALASLVESTLATIARGRFVPPSPRPSATSAVVVSDGSTTRIGVRIAAPTVAERAALEVIAALVQRCGSDDVSQNSGQNSSQNETTTTADSTALYVDDVSAPVLIFHINGPSNDARARFARLLARLSSPACALLRYEPLVQSSQLVAQSQRRVRAVLNEQPATTATTAPITPELVRAALVRIEREVALHTNPP